MNKSMPRKELGTDQRKGELALDGRSEGWLRKA